MYASKKKSPSAMFLGIPLFLIAGGMVGMSAASLNAPPPPWIASSRYARKPNPLPATADVIAAGAKVYEAQCVACHGKTGAGDGIRSGELDPKPHDLSNPSMWLQSDGELYYKTVKGRRPMPSFKKIISEDEIWQAIRYVRTLAPKPTVLGARFDVGTAPRAALGKVVAATTKLSGAAANSDTEQIAASTRDLLQACESLKAIDLSGQDKSIDRAWKSTASHLFSYAGKLDTASDEQSRSIALGKFTESLASALRLFGGVETGRVYQFSVTSDTGDVHTWIQSESTACCPFPSMKSSKSSVVAVFGPKTSVEK